jgi:hypothetical protein
VVVVVVARVLVLTPLLPISERQLVVDIVVAVTKFTVLHVVDFGDVLIDAAALQICKLDSSSSWR